MKNANGGNNETGDENTHGKEGRTHVMLHELVVKRHDLDQALKSGNSHLEHRQRWKDNSKGDESDQNQMIYTASNSNEKSAAQSSSFE